MSKGAAIGAGIAGAGGLMFVLKGLAAGGAKLGGAAKLGAAGLAVGHADDIGRLGANIIDPSGYSSILRSADDIRPPPLIDDLNRSGFVGGSFS